MNYGEIIIGPPGSGKTTYILEKSTKINRKPILINLDPGNILDSSFDYSIRQLYNTDTTMTEKNLGPNGALIEIINMLVINMEEILTPILSQEGYFIFDFPGQVEFLITETGLISVLEFIKRHVNLAIVNLFDVVHFYDQFSRNAMYLLATTSLLILECSQICVISKCDNIKRHGKLDLERISNLEEIDNEEKIQIFNRKFINEINNFINVNGLLRFQILDVTNLDTIIQLQYIIDCSNGYAYEDENNVIDLNDEIKNNDELMEYYNNLGN